MRRSVLVPEGAAYASPMNPRGARRIEGACIRRLPGEGGA